MNEWQEDEGEWARVGGIRAAVSAGTGGGLQRTNDMLRIDSTHTAATWDAVKVGDRLAEPGAESPDEGYEVLYIIDGGRRKMHQLFLKKVEHV